MYTSATIRKAGRTLYTGVFAAKSAVKSNESFMNVAFLKLANVIAPKKNCGNICDLEFYFSLYPFLVFIVISRVRNIKFSELNVYASNLNAGLDKNHKSWIDLAAHREHLVSKKNFKQNKLES